MIVRETQTPSYWQEFALDDRDLDYLYELFLEDDNRPRTVDDLALALVRRRCEVEKTVIERELTRGTPFQPKDAYELGEQVVFPAFGYALGSVVGMRPGNNPKYGEFAVIQVQFEVDGRIREFASQLDFPHKLNREEGQLLTGEGLLPPIELYSQYGSYVRAKLLERLQQSSEFVRFRDEWYLKGLLAEIHEVHLNIAEAVLDVRGVPLPAEELLPELDMPTDISPAAQVFSVNHALAQDGRFDDVGDGNRSRWFLQRLEPPDTLRLPPRLHYTPVLYDRRSMGEEMLRWEMEIDDELTEAPAPSTGEEVSKVTIVLSYPHRHVGTIPLTSMTEHLFPYGDNERMVMTFVDGRTGTKMLGWVVRRHKYVYGLKEWYEKNDIPAGAYIQLERTDDPLTLVVDYRRRRKKREWVRVAGVERGRLTFNMQMRSIGCDYDDLMIVGEDERREIDSLWKRTEEEGVSLSDLIRQIFPELAKLNPQGTVHVKTLYSAINVQKRCPPGPILAELAHTPSFLAVGDGYWVYDRDALQA